MTMSSLKFAQRPAPAANHVIGAILAAAGRLDPERIERILKFQQQHGALRFGEAGVRLGLLTEEDIRYALSQQFEHPCLTPGDVSLSPEVLAAFRPRHPFVEALRGLRSQLLLRRPAEGAAGIRLAITSACRGEGRSLIAANLAVLFAQLGERVVLIDADLRNPRQHALFRVGDRLGLSTVLSGRAGLEAVTALPALGGLSLLTAGPSPPNPQELLSRARFRELLEQLNALFGVVVLDCPAWAEAADLQLIAARAGSAIVVSQPNAATVAEATALVRALRESGAQLLGAVVNRH